MSATKNKYFDEICEGLSESENIEYIELDNIELVDIEPGCVTAKMLYKK